MEPAKYADMSRCEANEARQKDVAFLVARLYNMILINDGCSPDFELTKDNIVQATGLIFSERGKFLPEKDIYELRELMALIKIDIIRDELDFLLDEMTSGDDKELITNIRDKCNEMLDATKELEDLQL